MAKALAHPLRVQLLSALNEGVASPNELAKQPDEPLTNVSYHVRMLHDLGCIELVDTEPRRGALEHYYRAIMRPFFGDRDWKRLPKNARARSPTPCSSSSGTTPPRRSRRGQFDDRENRHLSRSVLCIDQQGWDELNELLVETLDRAMGIQADSASRAAKQEDRPLQRQPRDADPPDAELGEADDGAELGNAEEVAQRRKEGDGEGLTGVP